MQRERGYTKRSRAKLGKPESTRSADRRRKALARGAVDAPPFRRIDVFHRDGWLCGICGDPIYLSIPYPQPLSKSLDHVLPVIAGGAHSFENCRASHLTCNVRRGAARGEDIAAISAMLAA
jgi:5-methylcytosine-specific restriction endonuclease McrA